MISRHRFNVDRPNRDFRPGRSEHDTRPHHHLSGSVTRRHAVDPGEAPTRGAWDILCADRFDVLITDHDMPEPTGLDLLRRVRSGPLKLPVILISGNMPWHEPALPELLPPGLAVEKPFTFSELSAHLRHLLAARASRRDEIDGRTLPDFEPAPPPLPICATG